MKKIDFKNKKTIWKIIWVLILILLIILFIRGLKSKSLSINSSKDNNSFDIANSQDYSEFNGKVSAIFEGSHSLNFSFLYNKSFKVVQGVGSQAKWFKFYNASNTNVLTLYFTYEGARGWSTEDYVNNILLNINSLDKVEDAKFIDDESSNIKYVVNEVDNLEYYIEELKGTDGSPWLAIVENKVADDDTLKAAAKDLMRSFNVNTSDVDEINNNINDTGTSSNNK